MTYTLKYVLSLALLAYFFGYAGAQPSLPCQPLVKEVSVIQCWLDQAAQLLEKGLADSALAITRPIGAFTEDQTESEAHRLYLNSLIYLNLSHYDSSFEAGKEAAGQYLKLNQKDKACKAFNAAGSALRDKGQLEEASEYYYKAIRLADELGSDSLRSPVYLNLSVVFLYLNDRPKQNEFILKSYRSAKRANDLSMIARASMGLVQLYNYKNDIDSAEYYAIQALESSQALDNPLMMGYAYLNLAHVARNKGMWEVGDQYFQQIIGDERISAFDRARFLYFYGEFLMEKNSPEAAKIPYEQAYQGARSLGALNLQHTIATRLHPLYEQLNDYPNAYGMALEEIALTDSIYQAEKEERIRELNTKYETIEKERALQAKKIEVIKRTSQRNTLLGLAAALLLVGGVTVFSLRRQIKLSKQLHQQKAEIANQKIQQLRQEQKYLAIQSMVAGEEAERSRLAKELHDGLGGMLSNLKLTLSSRLGHSDNTASADSVAIVDRASSELRRIAQNMMPESLARFGLIQALEDLVGEIPASTGMQASFQHFNVQEPLPTTFILPLYRIVQELLNNVIKHAKASEVLIQLIQRDQALYLTVEDNGAGMKWSDAVQKGGQGLRNIQSRVEFLKGNLQVESTEKTGTSVNIEIPIPPDP